MPGRRLPRERRDEIAKAAAAGELHAQIAKREGVSERTVTRILSANAELVQQFQNLNELGLKAAWGSMLENTYADYAADRAAGKLSWRERQAAALTMAISTDKLLVSHGRASVLVENLHEHRFELADIAERFFRVTQPVLDAQPPRAALPPASGHRAGHPMPPEPR